MTIQFNHTIVPANDRKLSASFLAEDCGCLNMPDEAQFLTRAQVYQLTEITDDLNIPVLAYALPSHRFQRRIV